HPQVIIELARRVWNFRLKKSVAMNLLRLDWRLSILDDVDLARVRPKRANGEIIPHPMRPEDSERIGMRAGEKGIQLIRRQPGDGERFHHLNLSFARVFSTR